MFTYVRAKSRFLRSVIISFPEDGTGNKVCESAFPKKKKSNMGAEGEKNVIGYVSQHYFFPFSLSLLCVSCVSILIYVFVSKSYSSLTPKSND